MGYLRQAELELKLRTALAEVTSLRSQLIESQQPKREEVDIIVNQQREIEHLRDKVREMDSLIRLKDQQLEEVFQSATFRVGSGFTRLIKGVVPKG